MISRRVFLGTLPGGLLASPLAADAQQAPPSRHIGVLLNAFSPEEQAPQAFRQGLRDAGYSVGGDVIIEWRAAHGDRSRLPALAAELVAREAVGAARIDEILKKAGAKLPVAPTGPVSPRRVDGPRPVATPRVAATRAVRQPKTPRDGKERPG